MKRIILLAMLLTACEPNPCTEKDFTLPDGMCFDLDTVEPQHREEMRLHLQTVVDTGLEWWGGKPSDVDGWKVTFTHEYLDNGRAQGMTYPDEKRIIVRMPPNYEWALACAEYIAHVLPHEIGHVVHPGDGNHRDPRWAPELDIITAMIQAGGARCGY